MKKYENYETHLMVLRTSQAQDLSNEFIISGIIDKFMIQFELGWKLLKELLKYEGVAAASTGSPRDIIKSAYKFYDFLEEDEWLSMLRDRNDSSHIYDGMAAQRLVQKILQEYIPAFEKLNDGLIDRYGEDFLKKPDVG